MVTKIKQIQNRKCVISLRSKVSWKLTLPAGFQPGGVFRFENKASGYFDTAIKDLGNVQLIPEHVGRRKIEIYPPQEEQE